MCLVGRKHKIHYLWRPRERDPKDDMVLEVAVAGQCEIIVTYNKREAQFVASAVAEKISALETEDFLNERAKRASRKKFDAALSKVPDREPDKHDRY